MFLIVQYCKKVSRQTHNCVIYQRKYILHFNHWLKIWSGSRRNTVRNLWCIFYFRSATETWLAKFCNPILHDVIHIIHTQLFNSVYGYKLQNKSHFNIMTNFDRYDWGILSLKGHREQKCMHKLWACSLVNVS